MRAQPTRRVQWAPHTFIYDPNFQKKQKFPQKAEEIKFTSLKFQVCIVSVCDTTCYQDQHRSVHSALDDSHRVASRGWGIRNVWLSLSLSFLSSSPSSPLLPLLVSCVSFLPALIGTHICRRTDMDVPYVCAHTSAGTCTHNMQHPEAGASHELILRSDAYTLVSIL